MKRYNMKLVMLLLIPILVIPTISAAHAQTTNEIDIATGAGSSAQANCVTTNNCFTPNPLTVPPGTTVTWKNTDTTTHVVCSGKVTDDTCGTVFEDDALKNGQTFQFTFANAGTYDYYCSVHPWMTGQVIVGASQTVPTPQPTPPMISLTTDRQSYNDGDRITISGTVSNYIVNTLVNIRIIDPIGNLVKVDQIDVGSDRTFSRSISARGALWHAAGTYQVKAQYGSTGTITTTIFQFSGSNVQSGDTSQVPIQPSPPTGALVTTSIDRSSYTSGDTIVISGQVQAVVSGTPLSIEILDPQNNVAKLDGIDVSQDGKYTYSTKAAGPYWKLNGIYTVKVQYGPPNVTAQTTFTYVTNNQATNAIYSLQFGGQTYNVPYIIQGGTVINMGFVPIHQSTLELSIITTTDGTITITLPRSLLDAKTTSGQDMPFAISIDGAEVTPQSESVNNGFRNITIQYLQGDSKIDITGTQTANSSTTNPNNPYLGCPDCNDIQQTKLTSGGTLKVGLSTDPTNPNTTGQTQLKINFINKQDDSIQPHVDYKVSIIQGSNQIFGIPLTHTASGSVTIPTQFQNSGTYQIIVEVDGVLFQPIPPESSTFTLQIGTGQNNPSQSPIPIPQPTSSTEMIIVNNPRIEGNHVTSDLTNNQNKEQKFTYLVQCQDSSGASIGLEALSSSMLSGGKFTASQSCGMYQGIYTAQIFILESLANPVVLSKPLLITSGTDTEINSQNYNGSSVTLSGTVNLPVMKNKVILLVLDPSSNLAQIAQPDVENDGKFTINIKSNGLSSKQSGTYTVKVYNGGISQNSLSFKYNATTDQVYSESPSAPQQNIQDINQAMANQAIAAEVNIGNDKTETKSIDNSVSIQTTNTTSNSLGVKVSAPDQTGPKVIVFNLNATTINVSNLKDLGVMYDGKAISPAPNMDAILHAKSTDNPSFAIVVTQSGVQVLVLVPHFSTHTITLTNMSKIIPAVPEFGPIVGVITIVSLIASITISRKFFAV